MDFFHSTEPLQVVTLTESGSLSGGCTGFEATLSNGVTIVATVFATGEGQFASFGCYDKRLQPEGPEPLDGWLLPAHLGRLKALDVISLAPVEQLNAWTAAINRLCMSTKRPWVNVQELTSLLVGTPS